MKTCEIFLMIDEFGNYTINEDEYELDPGNLDGSRTRVVRILVDVPLPVVTTVRAVVPDWDTKSILETEG